MFKEALFSICPDRTIEPVETAAGTTYVRTLTVREKDELGDLITTNKELRVPLLIACCCAENGAPEFDEFDAKRLGELPAHVVEPIVDVALRLNKMRPEDGEKVRKNSENGRTSSSGTS